MMPQAFLLFKSKSLKRAGKTLEKPKSVRLRSSRTVENVGRVNQSVRDDPNLSIRKRASALNVHRSSLHRVLHKGPKLHPKRGNVNTSLPRVREIFPGKLISRRGDINWPPRSPDLIPIAFFLWGYLKSKV